MIASAPGKLFLLGEYAVLEGAPAALVPVSQTATVSLSPDSKGIVTSIGTEKKTLSTSEALSQFSLLAAVVEELNVEARLTSCELILDTSAFHRNSQKLGLGSSAALTAALTRLFLPDVDETEVLAAADASHRRFQGGTGSGADVALSVYGRPIVFTQSQTPESLSLPDSLHMLAIWTGLAASTVDYVRQVQSWQSAHKETWQQQLETLWSIVNDFIAAATDSDTHQILATIDQYNRQLSVLSKVSGVNFYTDAHVALQKKVESARCVYKPSGAGGGDFGIAFSADKNELITLAKELETEKTYSFFLT